MAYLVPLAIVPHRQSSKLENIFSPLLNLDNRQPSHHKSQLSSLVLLSSRFVHYFPDKIGKRIALDGLMWQTMY